ncbi:Shedu immune nuclease family protein [Exiguobacterium oxidotolerans]|uniref:Shedu immune nuclease family protein n=1 Tax=Exiguobacterium oxidotolerans TaxID=223958 RepID=UPI000494BAF3|nr:Shedu immune nuclease family protein [Exiguobacterium oxidotolerans]
MDIIDIKKKSFSVSDGSEIVLRKTKSTKMVFIPTLIDDPYSDKTGVKAKIVFLKKGFNEKWERYKEVDANNMKAGQWTQLELSLGETQKLLDGLQQCNLILKEFGLESSRYSLWDEEEIAEKEKADQIISLLSKHDTLIDELLENNHLVEKVFQWISQKKDIGQIVNKLESLEIDDLDRINSVVGLTKLKRVLSIWEDNKELNQSEKFWQDVLKDHTWILSQIFSTPTVLIQKEAYIGGKAYDNRGGNVVDFFLANPFTKDSVLIEIKTPQEKLLHVKPYRELHPPHTHIVGAVSQVLNYKLSLLSKIDGIVASSIRQGKDIDFEVINPSCVVIAGRLGSLNNQLERNSFEIYRKELATVTLITFDELFDKVKSLIDLLEKN